jgi:hypothetical protein
MLKVNAHYGFSSLAAILSINYLEVPRKPPFSERQQAMDDPACGCGLSLSGMGMGMGMAVAASQDLNSAFLPY